MAIFQFKLLTLLKLQRTCHHVTALGRLMCVRVYECTIYCAYTHKKHCVNLHLEIIVDPNPNKNILFITLHTAPESLSTQWMYLQV